MPPSSSYTPVNRPVALVASIPFLAPDPTRSTIIDDFLVARLAIAMVYRVFLVSVADQTRRQSFSSMVCSNLEAVWLWSQLSMMTAFPV